MSFNVFLFIGIISLVKCHEPIPFFYWIVYIYGISNIFYICQP